MRDQGLERALQASGGVRALARSLGLSQPSVSMWKRIPVARIAEVELATGLSRAELRPDLFAQAMTRPVDPVAEARSQEYALLAALLWRAPDISFLNRLQKLKGDASPIGVAHGNLGMAAAEELPESLEREFFNLFVGVGRGELVPYASFYLTGFLHERPLARIRSDLRAIGIEKTENSAEPEDHIAILFEVMSILALEDAQDAKAAAGAFDSQIFFERHLRGWALRFFQDLEEAKAAKFYRAVGALGRLFMEVEAEAFSLAE